MHGSPFPHGTSIRRPWFIAAAAMVLFIWCNSLVPGTPSGTLSLGVADALRAALDVFGIPSAWVTNFVVRKAAHVTEYAVLGVLVAQALDLRRGADVRVVAAACIVLLLVPSVDETIQLFVPGRSGQLSDVLLDCCGAATGAYLTCMLKPGVF